MKLQAFLLAALLFAAIPYNLFTQTPYWVATDKYAKYRGAIDVPYSMGGLNVTRRYEHEIYAYIKDVSDVVLVNVSYVSRVLQAVAGSAEFTEWGSAGNWTLHKIRYDTGDMLEASGQYGLFYLPKMYIDVEQRYQINVILSPAINATGQFIVSAFNFTVMEEVDVETKLADWATRKAWRLTTTIKYGGQDIIINLYYDVESHMLLELEYYIKQSGMTLRIVLEDTNISPPQITDKIILFVFSVWGLVLAVMIIVIFAAIKLIRLRIRRGWVRAGVVRTAYGVERLR